MKYHDVSAKLILIGLSLFLMSCGQEVIEKRVIVPPPVLSIRQATALQCQLGGSAIYLNNILQTLVCNRLNSVNDTFITPVQLCDGPAPEYGLVVGNAVYAIYGANGGYLVLLPPGLRKYTEKNPNCSFRIKENGEIEK